MSRPTIGNPQDFKHLAHAAPPGETENLTTLENLNEETLLLELKTRYKKNIIYTYVGEILVAINPFKTIDGIYAEAMSRTYCNIGSRASQKPHLFAVADTAFQSMAAGQAGVNSNQVCVISGESGAGKTESAKLFIKHIIYLSTRSSGTEAPMEGKGLEEKIIQLNPLLEAFGNAQTLMNDNSSRFGKFIELRFNEQLHITGSLMYDYLLEKSRVVFQNAGERNFHVFYLIFSGLTPSEREEFHLGDPAEYNYINENDAALAQIGTKEMKMMYQELREGLDIVGFQPNEVKVLFKVLSAILHMGDVEFAGDDAAYIVSSDDVLGKVSELLEIENAAMHDALCSSTVMTRGENVTRAYKPFQAEATRDAFSKALYERIFQWIVKKVNQLLGPKYKSPTDKTISILDIFGFECFDTNSFEQLLINLANEQLQFFFNNHIFKMELDEYAREGIDGSKISYEDNQPVLDMLLSKPLGLLAIMDEEALFPNGTDSSMIEKFHNHLAGKKGYERPPGNADIFTVKHYAGSVTYEGQGFLEKNRDTLAMDVIAVMRMSENELLASLFGAEVDKKGARGKSRKGKSVKDRKKDFKKSMKRVAKDVERGRKTTVSAEFKNSLAQLMKDMNAAAPHFVRCIKPNMQKRADYFVDDLTTTQLRYTGMLETTRIRKEGYSHRPAFGDFINRYKIIAFPLMSNPPAAAGSCQTICAKAGIEGWQVGKTKVFLRYFHVDQLNQILLPFPVAASKIQAAARGFVARSKYAKLREERARLMKQVADLCHFVEVKGQAMLTVVQALCEDDAMRPPDFFEKKKQELSEDKAMRKLQKKANAKKGAVTRQQSVKWFKEIEMKKGAGVDKSGNFNEWFHGIITRKQAEELLMDKEAGTFLVRVAESRFGYSLSHCVSEGGRIKHYMIDQTPDGQYQVVGNRKLFPSLNALVDYHQSHNIVATDPVCLIEACGQEGEFDDTAELRK